MTIEPARPRLRIAVLDDYLGVADSLAPWSSLEDAEVTFFREPLGSSVEGVAAALAPFDVVCAMRERTPLPASVLDRLTNLRLLVTTGMQNASVDVAAARARGVVVSGTGSSSEATAELTWALILAAARHIPAHDREMRAGGWQRHLGRDLAGRRLGVIGLGRNGTRVAKIGRAFGMEIMAWSENLPAERAEAAGARPVTKAELLGASDVITVHLRLSERTTGLIGQAEFGQMRPTAILVNTSRGPIVDEVALVEALRSGRIAAAALDVYDEEPLPVDHPLRSIENVVLSPHTGYVTEGNMRRFYMETVEDIAAFIRGAPIRVL